MNKNNMKPPPGLPRELDLSFKYNTTGLPGYLGSGSNLDFSQNKNELAKPVEQKWDW